MESDLRRSFLAFRNECVWLQQCFNTYQALFEAGDETNRLLHRAAALFFDEINRILIDYCFLQVCRITDRAKVAGHGTLTVEYLDSELRKAGPMTAEIEGYSQGVLRYRSFAAPARNQLIAHASREAMLNPQIEAIGAHPPEETEAFFRNLYGYVDAVGIAVGEGPLDFRVTSGPGDVMDLLKLIRSGIAARAS